MRGSLWVPCGSLLYMVGNRVLRCGSQISVEELQEVKENKIGQNLMCLCMVGVRQTVHVLAVDSILKRKQQDWL